MFVFLVTNINIEAISNNINNNCINWHLFSGLNSCIAQSVGQFSAVSPSPQTPFPHLHNSGAAVSASSIFCSTKLYVSFGCASLITM